MSGGRIDPSVTYVQRLAIGPIDRAFLLRRARFAGRRIREAADSRRRPGRPTDLGVLGATARAPSSSTSRPTASRTATIIPTATWRWPMHSTRSQRRPAWRSPITASFSRSTRRSGKSRSSRTRRGAACTAWSGGGRTAAATRGGRAGSRTGGPAPRGARWPARRRRYALYERDASRHLLKDPWAARNDYIDVLLDRQPENVDAFFTRHARRMLTPAERSRAIKLLEMQRHALLMYTSCGWFFDEISGTESVQVLMYAGRVIQLAEELCGAELEPAFLEQLARAPSNLPQLHASGREVYEKYVRTDAARLAEHRRPLRRRLALSVVRRNVTRSLVTTWFRKTCSFTRPGRSSWSSGTRGSIRRSRSNRGTSAMRRFISGTTTSTPVSPPTPVTRLTPRRPRSWPRRFPAWIRHRSCGSWTADSARPATRSPRSFATCSGRCSRGCCGQGLTEITEMYQHVFDRNLPLMRFLKHLAAPIPMPLQATAQVLFNSDLRWALKDDDPDLEQIRRLVEEAQTWNVPLDSGTLGFQLTKMLDRAAAAVGEYAEQLEPLAVARGQPRRGARASVRAQPLDAAERLLRRARTRIRRRWPSGPRATRPPRNGSSCFCAVGEKLGIVVDAEKKKADERRARPGIASLVDELIETRHVPNATYRLQFNSDFTFRGGATSSFLICATWGSATSTLLPFSRRARAACTVTTSATTRA